MMILSMAIFPQYTGYSGVRVEFVVNMNWSVVCMIVHIYQCNVQSDNIVDAVM